MSWSVVFKNKYKPITWYCYANLQTIRDFIGIASSQVALLSMPEKWEPKTCSIISTWIARKPHRNRTRTAPEPLLSGLSPFLHTGGGERQKANLILFHLIRFFPLLFWSRRCMCFCFVFIWYTTFFFLPMTGFLDLPGHLFSLLTEHDRFTTTTDYRHSQEAISSAFLDYSSYWPVKWDITARLSQTFVHSFKLISRSELAAFILAVFLVLDVSEKLFKHLEKDWVSGFFPLVVSAVKLSQGQIGWMVQKWVDW